MIVVVKSPTGKNQLLELTPHVASFAALQSFVSGRTLAGNIIVDADETTLDQNGNPQKVTYYYDGTTLWYVAYSRADGTVTVAGSDGIGTMTVADNTALLASATVYRDTLIKVVADADNTQNAGFYIKESNGKIHRIATYPIN